MAEMAPAKLLYIVVVDNGEGASGRSGGGSFRYTRPVLQSTLQLMGCKARHAFKMSRSVFEVLRSECSDDDLPPCIAESGDGDGGFMSRVNSHGFDQDDPMLTCQIINNNVPEKESKNGSSPFELYKRKSTIVVGREKFLDVSCDTLSRYKYVGPSQRADLMLACRVRERKESVTVLLCGTSGCGKSTLSALLGSRLGITTVISTDSIRHMMRSFADEKQNPLLWASTYHAGEYLDPMAVAEAKAKRKAQKLVCSPKTYKEGFPRQGSIQKFDDKPPSDVVPSAELIGKKQMAIEGFKAQSEMVIDSLDRLITAWEDRKESIIVEGVHLSLNFVMGLMKKHPSIIPFMIYIGNEEKHIERFAIRAKYMALDPSRNKYVKYIRNIRIIQEYLCNRADKHLVPKVNNTNVDKSVAAIHATVFSCLRRRQTGEKLYDPATNTVSVIEEEYRSQCTANSLISKGMLQLIQRKGSTRHLMALLNLDGTIAKAWPVESRDGRGQTVGVGSEKCTGNPMYGPLAIAKAEPVNLQFGTFGISAWPSDMGCASHTGSIDDSRADGTDTGSRYLSSCCSSPRISEGHSKELKEEFAVSVSEDEPDDPYGDSDDDIAGPNKKDTHSEMEGSVDEDLTKLDEEYEDLAMLDSLENGYWSEDDESSGDGGDGGKAAANGRLPGRHYNLDRLSEKFQENKLVLQIPGSYSMLTGRSAQAWIYE